MQVPPPKREILLAEDDRVIRLALKTELEKAGYCVRTAADGVKALEMHADSRPDLMLLDVMMPRMDGLELCRRVRATDTVTPILFLTALDSDENELRGLDAGADGYIAKTVSGEVLVARIAAAIRRNLRDNPIGDFAFCTWRVFPCGNSMRNPSGRLVALSDREIAILRLFASNPGETISRDFIGARIWDRDDDRCENALTVAIARLREKLGADGRTIEAVRGSGYVFRP